MSSEYAIEARGLAKSYGDVHALRGVDLYAERGSMLALLGPNGAGKTTVIRILTTLLIPDGGTATVGGHDVVRAPARVREVIGLTGQEMSVDGLLTGRENLVMMGRLFHLGKSAARQRADDLLEQFDLTEAAGRQARWYSGGMRRRLDLAVSLITAPPVIFLDEPTTGLDPRSRQGMWEVIRKLMADGTTILLTTQYLEEADILADRVALIDGGAVVAEGAPGDLKRRIGSERVEFQFATEDTAEKAQLLVGGAVLHGTGLSVPAADPAEVRHLINRVADAGFDATGLEIRRPTLDDVFLTMTGQTEGATL